MNWKAFAPIILAIVLGLVAAKLGRDVLLRGRVKTDQKKFAPLVVAVGDLEVGQTVQAENLSVASMSLEHRPGSGFENKAELAGRVLVLPAVKGQAILESMLAAKGSGQGPAALIPSGMRAVSVEVNETHGLAGILLPGARVDVVSTLKDPDGDESVTRTIVENVKVLAVGQRLSSDAAPKSADPNNLPRSATLLVLPRDAEAIELATSTGRVRLSLRSPLDESTTRSKGLTVLNLLGRTRSGTMQALARFLTSVPKPVAAPIATQQPEQAPIQVIQAPPKPATRPVEQRWVEVIRSGVASRVAVEPSQQGAAGAMTNTDSQPVIPERPGD